MIKKLVCAAALLVVSTVGADAVPLLSITPAASNVRVGDVFTLDIKIEGVSDLYGWEMDLGFGPVGLLNASSATVGGFLGLDTDQTFGGGTVDNAAGTITTMFSALSGPVGVTGDGILASISFQAIDVGSVTLALANVTLLDSNLDQIFFNWPDDASSAVVNITRDGSPVPEPSTLALFGVASSMLWSRRRRAQHRQR